MLNNCVDEKRPTRRSAWFWRRLTVPALVALLVFGFVGMGAATAMASASTPLRPDTVSDQHSDAAPAVVLANGAPWVAWTGTNKAHNLNIVPYNAGRGTFTHATTFTDRSPADSGPSLAKFGSAVASDLYVAWRGTDNRLNVAHYNPFDPTHLANKVTLNEFSYNSPSIAVFTGRLYLSWRGTDGRLNIISSANGTTFDTKVTYNIKIRTSPTLVTTPLFLEIGWEQPSAQAFIVIAQYNTSQPATLSVVVTTTSTSQLPVALSFAGVAGYPALVMAWRTASDALILLGYFGGNPTITGIVNTGQTTPYGPALDRPYLAWTGTDRSHSVNVSTESL
ncbi:MAG: hypothetical protein ACLQUY_23655 [Ktedonobacterales bacterium]